MAQSPQTNPDEPGPGRQEERFERLFERYYRPVSYFFANRGFSREECRDLTQETFLGVYKGMEAFRRDASVETWLFTIAGNVWRNALRSRAADKRTGQEVALATADEDGREVAADAFGAAVMDERDPLRDTLAAEQARLLRAAIAELPAQMYRCLTLRIDQGMKYREIAAVMQISIDTVKSQLFQARERLKDRLADHFTDFDL